jgi:hypothetical protein
VRTKFWIPFLVLVLSMAAGIGSAGATAASRTPLVADASALFAQDAGDDLDCEDFQTQEEAQTVLEEDPADPNNLDPNGDGIACALLPAASDLNAEEGDTAAEQEAETGNLTREERRAARQAEQQQNEEGQAVNEAAETPTCADFATAEEAQAAYDADPEGLAGLDADGNGVACEELLNVEPAADEASTAERRRNRRNQEEEPAPVEVDVVVDEPETRRNRRNQEEESAAAEVVVDEPESVRIQEDFDCVDFEFQEEAQEVYDQDPSDPYNLDPNGDGFACSSLPSSGPKVSRVPSTGVGPATSTDAGLLVAAALLISRGAAGVTLRAFRR